MHELHSGCHTRRRQPLFCPTHNRIVDRSEVVKGYEYEPDKCVLVEPGDLKKIQPEWARTMEILSFAKASEIAPLHFDASYFLVPEEEGRKAYLLLEKTLEDSKRVAIAKLTMHQREYMVFIRPHSQGLALHTMYFANEIRQAPGYGEVDHVKLAPQEIRLAEQLVSILAQPFDLKQYHDDYQQRLNAVIEARRTGEDVAVTPEPKRAPVIDIMSALEKSLAGAGKQVGEAGQPQPVFCARRAHRIHRPAVKPPLITRKVIGRCREQQPAGVTGGSSEHTYVLRVPGSFPTSTCDDVIKDKED